MKHYLFLVLFSALTFLIACDNDSVKSLSQNDPVQLAKTTLEIVKIGNDEKKLTDYFKKMGMGLVEGAKRFNSAYDEIKKSPELYTQYHNELGNLVNRYTLGDKLDMITKIPEKKETSSK